MTGRPCSRDKRSRQIRHPGAAKHNGLGMVVRDGLLDFGGDARAGVRARVFQFEDRHLRRANPRAPRHQAVADEIMFDGGNRPGQSRDHRELSRDQARHVEARFADPDHRRLGGAARRIEAGIVETGDHVARRRRASLSSRRSDPGWKRPRRNTPRCWVDRSRGWRPSPRCRSTPPACAAAPIFSVIEAVVFGLITWMCMGSGSRSRLSNPR